MCKQDPIIKLEKRLSKQYRKRHLPLYQKIIDYLDSVYVCNEINKELIISDIEIMLKELEKL
jgi:hypothetical protein